ncbi:tRNA 2-selenouridine synthase-like [Littorina saxatilis]|uniref:Rhodanese domain-containing protein n=1 Tax=Littorina saxatilis TaxID=31220 RepID=A0AAN9B7E3_9CAEN
MWRGSMSVMQPLCTRRSAVFTSSCQCMFRNLYTKTLDPFDPNASEVIDTRAPLEYQQDHIPGAVNLPVLTNEQRSHVGEVYNKDSFEARKLGASLVTRNISQHISHYFINKPAHYQPLVYCWRGGQRSQSLSIVLSQTGFEVRLLEGGYRTYRRRVISDLQQLPEKLKYIVLTGLTGTGKTLLLHALSRKGAQVLDLEGLARHKGSLLGLWHQETQPSQKMWESLLRHRLASFDPAKPVWVESESAKVGNLLIPMRLFHKMCRAERVEVCLPMEERVKHILRDYPHWMQDVSTLKSVLLRLKKVRGQKTIDSWFQLADQGRWEEFVEQLLVQHYDSTYTMSQKKNEWSKKKIAVHLKDLSGESQMEFVDDVLDSTKHSTKTGTEVNFSV